MRRDKISKLAMAWVLVLAMPCLASAEDNDAMYQSLMTSLSKTQIHGFLSQGFLWSSDNDYLSANTSEGDFRFNELGINFGFDLTEKLRVGLQLFSQSLGSTGNNEIVLDWAYADYRYKDWLGFRAGKIKLPMGFYNETRDIDQIRSYILMPESVYSEFERSFYAGLLGFGIYGDINVASFGSLSYQGLVGTQNLSRGESNFIKRMENAGISLTEAEIDYLAAGSMIWNTPVEGLRVGATVEWWNRLSAMGEWMDPNPYNMPPGTPLPFNADGFIRWVASIEYVMDEVTLAAEFTQQTAGVDNSTLMYHYDVHQEGYYVHLSYRLTESLEMGTYYAMYWPDASDRHGRKFVARGQKDYKGWQQDIALSARYDIFQSWSVKIEGHYMNGTGHIVSSDNPVENWFLGALKTSFAF